uniref:Uncharacterized protein n=1 Tax=Rhizophora mucronata TaxID=61149 RepID=A0A2P2QYU3_RHIMU
MQFLVGFNIFIIYFKLLVIQESWVSGFWALSN